MWPKCITSLTFHLQLLLTQNKTFNSGNVSALHLLSEIFSACGGIPSFVAVKLYEKLIPEMHHFTAFHHLFLLR